MPIFVNFTKRSAFYQFFGLIIGFLWLFQTIPRVFQSKTFVFESANNSIFSQKKPCQYNNRQGFYVFSYQTERVHSVTRKPGIIQAS